MTGEGGPDRPGLLRLGASSPCLCARTSTWWRAWTRGSIRKRPGSIEWKKPQRPHTTAGTKRLWDELPEKLDRALDSASGPSRFQASARTPWCSRPLCSTRMPISDEALIATLTAGAGPWSSAFGTSRSTLGMDVLRCKSPRARREGNLDAILGYNLVRALMLEASWRILGTAGPASASRARSIPCASGPPCLLRLSSPSGAPEKNCGASSPPTSCPIGRGSEPRARKRRPKPVSVPHPPASASQGCNALSSEMNDSSLS